MLTSEIKIDVNNHTAPDIYARVGESNTRRVKFYPGYYDPDGNFVGLSTEEESIRVEFRMVKPDNTFVLVDLPISIVEDPITFRVMLTPEMCQVSGSGYYDIRISDSEEDSDFLYTASGRFIIDDNMLTDEMIESVAAANGYVFPDDFLTTADLEDFVTQEQLDDYATKEYVDDAIAGAASFSKTVLFSNDSGISFRPNSPQVIELSDAYTNYDILVFDVAPSSTPGARTNVILLTDLFRASPAVNGVTPIASGSWCTTEFIINDATHFNMRGSDSSYSVTIYKIVGLKW